MYCLLWHNDLSMFYTSRFNIHWLVRACESILQFQRLDSNETRISQNRPPPSLSVSAMVTDGKREGEEGERETWGAETSLRHRHRRRSYSLRCGDAMQRAH